LVDIKTPDVIEGQPKKELSEFQKWLKKKATDEVLSLFEAVSKHATGKGKSDTLWSELKASSFFTGVIQGPCEFLGYVCGNLDPDVPDLCYAVCNLDHNWRLGMFVSHSNKICMFTGAFKSNHKNQQADYNADLRLWNEENKALFVWKTPEQKNTEKQKK